MYRRWALTSVLSGQVTTGQTYRFWISLVSATDKVSPCVVFSPSKAGLRQPPYRHARGERRPSFVEGSQSTRWLGYVQTYRSGNFSE